MDRDESFFYRCFMFRIFVWIIVDIIMRRKQDSCLFESDTCHRQQW